MNKLTPLLFGLIFFLSGTLQAQSMYNHSFAAVAGTDSLTVTLQASFPFGAGEACPQMTWDRSQGGDTVYFRAYYFVGGVWPQLGCSQSDAVTLAWPFPGPCILSVQFFETNGAEVPMDTSAVDMPETVSICSMAIPEHTFPNFRVYPAPFVDHVKVIWDGPRLRNADIMLTDASGRSVFREQRTMESEGTIHFPKDLPPGNYLLSIEAEGIRSAIPLQRARR